MENFQNVGIFIYLIIYNMETQNLQHVQLPNRAVDDTITPQDQLIYISIKRFMNNQTKEAFPSLDTIAEKSGASVPTVRKCIKNLEEADYIKVIKKGRQNIYKFNPYKEFEPFSYEFLDKKDLTFLEKTYLVASQQYMFKVEGEGSMSFTNKELSEKINMSEASVSRCNRSLESKGYLEIINNENREMTTGCKTQTKLFHLNKFGQAVVFLLKNHEDRITETENDIDQLKKTNELLLREIADLKAKLEDTPKPEIIL